MIAMRSRRLARHRLKLLANPPQHVVARQRTDVVAIPALVVVWVLEGFGFAGTGDRDRATLRAQGASLFVALLLASASVPLAAVVAVAGWQVCEVLAARQRHQAETDLVDEMVLACQLSLIAVRAGYTVSGVVGAIAPHLDGRLGDALRSVVREHGRGTSIVTLLDGVRADLSGVVAPFITILCAAHTDGDPVAPALERLVDRLSDERRRRVAEDARRLSVRLVVPLVACSLPGFVLVAVVPLVVGVVGRNGH